MQPDTQEQHRVVTRNKREVFAGTQEDAQQYVRNNFPRLHIEPGTTGAPEPDAAIIAPDNSITYFNGSEFVDPNASDDEDITPDNDPDE